jgi:hypothetical protein
MTIEEVVAMVERQGFREQDLLQLRAQIARIIPGPTEEDEARFKDVDSEARAANDLFEGDPKLYHYAHLKIYMRVHGVSLKEAMEWGRRMKLKI